MKINADFSVRAAVREAASEWIPSPMQGVHRKLLDRIGGEVARATSMVRYAPGSSFSEHTHSGGEEFIVLEGVFQDEHGDYPAGTYVRNPIGTHHVPRSDGGCTIFVKLWQFADDDRQQFALDLNALDPEEANGGVACTMLHRHRDEVVALESWTAGIRRSLGEAGGLEILVLDGAIVADGERFGRHDWLRLAPGESAEVSAGPEGARLWVKRGHLLDIIVPSGA